MLQLMEDITDRDDWTNRMFDGAVLEKWHADALERPLISEAAWRWCVAELRDKAASYRAGGRYITLNVNYAIGKSDNAMSPQLQDILNEELAGA